MDSTGEPILCNDFFENLISNMENLQNFDLPEFTIPSASDPQTNINTNDSSRTSYSSAQSLTLFEKTDFSIVASNIDLSQDQFTFYDYTSGPGKHNEFRNSEKNQKNGAPLEQAISSVNSSFSFDDLGFDSEKFMQESYENNQSQARPRRNIIGRIYNFTESDQSKGSNIGYIELSNKALQCKLISKSIIKTINDELSLEKAYLKCIKEGKHHVFKEKIKKRRNPSSDHLRWEPLSIFTAFTNFKTSHFDNTDYFENIPHTSCVGKINMRVKRAWVRGPNKNREVFQT